MKRCVSGDVSNPKSALCLSLLCEGRSVDLMFENVQERDAWYELLAILVEKESGKNTNIFALPRKSKSNLNLNLSSGESEKESEKGGEGENENEKEKEKEKELFDYLMLFDHIGSNAIPEDRIAALRAVEM